MSHLRGEKLNYKSVVKDAEELIINQRFPARHYARRTGLQKWQEKSNL